MSSGPAHFTALAEIDRRRVLHPSTPVREHSSGRFAGARVVTGAEGVQVVDHTGRRLFDAFAGLTGMNVGYGRAEVLDAIAEQGRELACHPSFAAHTTEALVRLSDRLVRMAPGEMDRVFYGVSGSDANETQVKLSWYCNNVLGRPRKKKIIAQSRGFHGCTIVSGSLTGLPHYHAGFDLPTGVVRHAGAPDHYWGAEPGEGEREFSARRAHELDRLICEEGPDTVAAFIAEPVLGIGGLMPPPAGYWPAIQAVLRRHDVLLIADEAVTGLGPTGRMFGCETYGIEPDLITLAGGLTSGYVPMSAVLIGRRVSETLESGAVTIGTFSHGYTASGHPLAAAAANAVLDLVGREDLPGNAARSGQMLVETLNRRLDGHPIVGEIRGVGLMAALELVEDRSGKIRFDAGLGVGARVSAAALELGLIARALPHGDVLALAPPLVTTEEEAATIAELAATAVEQVTGELLRDGTWRPRD